jgi:hypothetical protein
MPVAKQDRRSKRIHHEGDEGWNSMRCRNGTMSYFNASNLKGGIKRFALWPLRGETILPSVIGQIPEMRRRYPLSL